MSDCWENSKKEVCSLCSNLNRNGTTYISAWIVTDSVHVDETIQETSSDWLIKVNESLYCERCWDEHIRTDELFNYELPKDHMIRTLNINASRVEDGWKPWPIHERNYNYWIKQGWMSTSRQVISWPRYSMFIVWREPIQIPPSGPDSLTLTKCLSSIAHWARKTLSTPPQSDTQLEPSSHSNILNRLPATNGKRLQEAPSSNTLRQRFSGDRRAHEVSYMCSQGASWAESFYTNT